MKEIKCGTIGEAWLESCKCIFKEGKSMKDGDKGIREIMHFAVTIKNPSENDEIVEKYADKEMVKWMLSNFLEEKKVPELKNAWSYGKRIFNYEGKNQLEWAVGKLKEKPETKSATISMIMKDDKDYIPCVSLLDFKIRAGKLVLIAMCRSIDFGNKVYANMIALNKIQKIAAEKIKVQCGELVMYVASAHIYDEDFEKLREILKNE